MQPNPPDWAQKALERFWLALKREVGLLELPAGSGQAELGCGIYGCVWATGTPGLALKLTTDRSEVAFAAASMTIERPPGIVVYHRLYQLGGAMKGRDQIYALWRDEVALIGVPRIARWLRDSLDAFKVHAQEVRRFAQTASPPQLERFRQEILSPRLQPDAMEAIRTSGPYTDHDGQVVELNGWNPQAWAHVYDRVDRMAIHYLACMLLATVMQREELLALVGQALAYYAGHGILLADVHSSNVGRNDEISQYVITDPGQAVFLDPKWSTAIQVPVLMEPKARKGPAVEPARAAFLERFRSQMRPMDPDARGHDIESIVTGPSSFRVDVFSRGLLTMQIDVALTAKGAKVTIAGEKWLADIARDTIYELRSYGKLDTSGWKIKTMSLDQAVLANPGRPARMPRRRKVRA